jgi:LPS-assembly protein
MSLGLGYIDECTTFSINYSVAPRDLAVTSGERDRNHTVLLRLELRTLGEVEFNQNLGGADTGQEGVSAQ